MARIRSLKPEAFQSETLADVSVEAERTFMGLTTQVDDRGRIADKPAVLNGALWAERAERHPHTASDLDKELEQLVDVGLVCRFIGCDGKRYLHLTTWDKHQKIDRPSRSRLPRCRLHGREDYCGLHDDDCDPPEPVPDPREPSRALDAGSRTVDLVPRTEEPSSSEIAARSDAPPDRPEIDQLCAHLAARIVENGNRTPRVGKRWREAARLMLDRDGLTVEQIHAAIDWCQNDEFWRANVLSMSTLRDKFDTLRQQARRQPRPGAQPSKPWTNPADQSVYDEDL